MRPENRLRILLRGHTQVWRGVDPLSRLHQLFFGGSGLGRGENTSSNLGGLTGFRSGRIRSCQHGILFGMTGAGKSVIVADLLAQIGHWFGFRLIVEEGLSHAVLTQTQGCEPIIVNPEGY